MERLFNALLQADLRAAELGRPLVTLAYAQSLDGCLTVERGRPTPLSGSEALRLTHRLRAAHEGILVGVGAVVADNPQLNVRLAQGASPRPLVLDTQLRIPLDAGLVVREENKPWILCSSAAAQSDTAGRLRACGCQVLGCELDAQGRVSMREALRKIGELGLQSVMIEGGAGVITSALKQRLFDLAVITIRPVWLGGLGAVQAGLGEAGRWPALVDVQYEPCGQDLVVWGKAAEVEL